VNTTHFLMVPNLADRKLYAFSSASTWPTLAPFIAGRIDEKFIIAQWNDVLRLTASVRTGTVSASLMLKRLGAYPRQNGLALALREIRRIERTLHAMDCWSSPRSGGRPRPSSTRARAIMRLHAPCAFIVSGGCTIARPRLNTTGRAASPSSRRHRAVEYDLSRAGARHGSSPR